jgi:hypothetical protein
MIRIEHRALPDGLSAVARRGAPGEVAIIVSDSLDADRQRAAVRAALRAARRHDWRLGLVPVPAFAFLATARSVLSKLGRFLRIHAVATAFAATGAGAVAATALVFAVPSVQGPASGAPPSPPGYQQSPSGPSAAPGHSSSRSGPSAAAGSTGPGVVSVVKPGAGSRPTPSPGIQPSPSPEPSTSTSAPAPPPSSSSAPAPPPSSSSAPAPTPTPTPSSSSSGNCLRILGVVVCL